MGKAPVDAQVDGQVRVEEGLLPERGESMTAYEMGVAAYRAGIRIPYYDERLTALLADHAGEKMSLLAAWYRGWTAASLSLADQAPIKNNI